MGVRRSSRSSNPTLSPPGRQMDVRRSVREPDFDADVNVLGTLRLLESCEGMGTSGRLRLDRGCRLR